MSELPRSSHLTPQAPVDGNQYLPHNQNPGSPSVLKEFAFSEAEKGSVSMPKSSSKVALFFIFIAIAAGVATGFGGYKLNRKTSSGSGPVPMQQVATSNVKAGDVFGVADESTFKDNAQGYLEAGGLDGEGSHHLVRPGGESQNVYLTSSVTDLDKFAGMEVKVWGETFQGQKAGWLMDVGRVQVINPQGQKPTENE